MRYHILHDIPGRIRVHCPNIPTNAESRITFERLVDERGGVTAASFSMRTGNLLLRYSRDTTRESVLVMLDGLRLFGVSTLSGDETGEYACQENEAPSICREFLRETATRIGKALLPEPAQKMVLGWKMAIGTTRAAQCLGRGQTGTLVVMIGKGLVFALCGHSFIAKFAARLVFAYCGYQWRKALRAWEAAKTIPTQNSPIPTGVPKQLE